MGYKCVCCGRQFSASYKCCRIDKYELCSSCAKRVSSSENIDDEVKKIFIENLPENQSYICDNQHSDNVFYYVMIVDAYQCIIPQCCTCCFSTNNLEKEKIGFSQDAFMGRKDVWYNMPICHDCTKHRSWLFHAAFNPGYPHSSSDVSVKIIPASDAYKLEKLKIIKTPPKNDLYYYFFFTNYDYAVAFKKANGFNAGPLNYIKKFK